MGKENKVSLSQLFVLYGAIRLFSIFRMLTGGLKNNLLFTVSIVLDAIFAGFYFYIGFTFEKTLVKSPGFIKSVLVLTFVASVVINGVVILLDYTRNIPIGMGLLIGLFITLYLLTAVNSVLKQERQTNAKTS